MGTYLVGITINDEQLINVYDEDGNCLAENWCNEIEMQGYIKALNDLGFTERTK